MTILLLLREFRVNSLAMAKKNLIGYSLAKLEQTMVRLKQPKYRGRQLYKWLYNTRMQDFSLMSDFSKSLREQLETKFEIKYPEIIESQKSTDGTEKFLFQFDDSTNVETVLIPDADRQAVCVSSQAGCALGCHFCATGTLGLMRNLTAGEILGQLIPLRDLYGNDCFTNIVFMGMGEPLKNYDNVVEAIKIITDSAGLMVSAKKITVSTSGISPKIRKLADSGLKVKLALSLHAATQEKRHKIMPVADSFGLDKLMDAVKYYTQVTGFRVTIEYILFAGFNDKPEDIKALVKLLHGVPCKINILAYNPVPGLDFERPTDEKVDWFARQLYPKMPAVTVRKSRGKDIDAACGQLAGRRVK